MMPTALMPGAEALLMAWQLLWSTDVWNDGPGATVQCPMRCGVLGSR